MIFIFAVLYLVFGAFIVLRLFDIHNRPERYEEWELEAAAEATVRRKRHSVFFKSLPEQYGTVNSVFFLLLLAASYIIIVTCSYLAAGDDANLPLDTQYGGVIAMLLPDLLLGIAIIPLHIRTSFFAVSIMNVFDVPDRYSIWKRGYKILLLLFLIGFPFYGLACNNYAHYNESGITISRYFQLGETYTAYEDIGEINIYIHHDVDGNPTDICYELRLSDGSLLDINNGNIRSSAHINKTTLEIHKLLEQNASCTPTITPLNDADLEYLTTRSAEQAEAIRYVFEGFHVRNLTE